MSVPDTRNQAFAALRPRVRDPLPYDNELIELREMIAVMREEAQESEEKIVRLEAELTVIAKNARLTAAARKRLQDGR